MGLPKSTLDELRIDRSAKPAAGAIPGWVWFGLVLLLLGLGLAGWWRLRSQIPTVQVVVVRESVAGSSRVLLNASGYVVARREATVSSKVTGKVIDVLVEE